MNVLQLAIKSGEEVLGKKKDGCHLKGIGHIECTRYEISLIKPVVRRTVHNDNDTRGNSCSAFMPNEPTILAKIFHAIS